MRASLPLALFLGLAVTATPPDGTTFVVLDAGSSGTRARLFHVKNGEFAGMPLPKGFDKHELAITPGVDKWETDGYVAKFQKMVDAAAKAIGGPEKAKKTAIWLKATAGMRQLKYEVRDKIMKAIRKYMKETVGKTFDYKSARIIAGEEEAYFAWIEANYLAKKFTGQTVGTVEMGGASLQLDFTSDTDIIDEASFLVFAEKRWPLYAKSFLGFGANEFGKRVDAAVKKSGGKNPCLSPALGGTADLKACQAIVDKLMREATGADQCFAKPCGMDGRYIQPVEDMTFWGIGGGLRFNLAYAANIGCLPGVKPGAKMPWPALSQTDIQKGAECLFNKVKTADGYKATVAALTKADKYFSEKFFKAPGPVLCLFASALLKAFNFPADKKNFVLNGEVNHVSVGFPMGSLMYETEQEAQANRLKDLKAEQARCDSEEEKAFEAAILHEIL